MIKRISVSQEIIMDRKTNERKKAESTERLIQKYMASKDAKEKDRILSIIRRSDPDFKPLK